MGAPEGELKETEMQDFQYVGMEGLREDPRPDVREEVYIRLIMRMLSTDREQAKFIIEKNGGVDSFAAMVNGQSPDAAWQNLQGASNVLGANQSGFDPDMY